MQATERALNSLDDQNKVPRREERHTGRKNKLGLATPSKCRRRRSLACKLNANRRAEGSNPLSRGKSLARVAMFRAIPTTFAYDDDDDDDEFSPRIDCLCNAVDRDSSDHPSIYDISSSSSSS